ncbi:MAG: hypothetical protein QHH24_07380 [Candidatus Bathyarchaeota archaeon]|nr:hypothetical protein [Candidatus Bathyarchaeota archaeon]
MQAKYTDAQQRLVTLNTLLNALQQNYTNLQLQHLSLKMNFSLLEEYVHDLSLVSGSSYYVFKQNSKYYAQNGFNATIEYYSENCTAVISYALDHTSPGGEVLLKALASDADAYYIDSTIFPPNCTTLASENRMATICLKSNCSKDIVNLHNVHHVQIRNIRICGNRWNQTDGNGIVISGAFGGSDHLMENVIIEDCNGTGPWIQYNQLNNTLRNVQIFHSGAYNVRIDSADNRLIDVESGWAGLSWFDVRGVDNYFLNCISWGCGTRGDQADCNGFSISEARNMFLGCDADRNDRGGFVCADANQTILVACIGRNNGQRVSGSWGFDLYNSYETIISACVATDEQESKTQDYGFTEGGNSDYNIVTDCNFEGNRVGAVFRPCRIAQRHKRYFRLLGTRFRLFKLQVL